MGYFFRFFVINQTKEFVNKKEVFCGSATTCYVAKRLNRKYIGIEKEKEYFNISKRRIDSI